MKTETRKTVIREEPVELCKLLKFEALTSTGGEAKIAIVQGLVQVNGEVETRKRKKIYFGDKVEFNGVTLEVVKEE